MNTPIPVRIHTGIDHYENFPVASILVPARLRPAVLTLYRFARHADDIADEGDASPGERLAGLERLRRALVTPTEAPHPMAAPMLEQLRKHGLGVDECLDLLSAFTQDVTVDRYADEAALRDYCRRSANPVGRMMLALFGCRDATTEALSDAVCTALQRINFLQDVAIDWRRGRLYLPQQALLAAGTDESSVGRAVEAGRASPELRACIAGQAALAGALLESGAALTALVPLRLSLELRATLAGGRRILERLATSDHDPFALRPRLGWRDAPAIVRLMFRPTRTR